MAANTLPQKITDETQIPDKRVKYGNDITGQDLKEYIRKHWHDISDSSMYLIGIEGLLPNEFVPPNVFGITDNMYPSRHTQYGNAPDSCFSVIFVQQIWNYYTLYHPGYKWTENEFLKIVDMATIHEMGHQRGRLTHPYEYPSYHTVWKPYECVMNRITAFVSLGSKDTVLLEHYDFCEGCKDSIAFSKFP